MIEIAFKTGNSPEWIPAAIGIAGVAVGSLLTHFSNQRIERYRKRSELNQHRIQEAYLPLCTSIELFKHYYDWASKRQVDKSDGWYWELFRSDEFGKMLESMVESSTARLRWLFLQNDRSKIDITVELVSHIESEMLRVVSIVQKCGETFIFTPEDGTSEQTVVEVSYDDVIQSMRTDRFDALSSLIECHPELMQTLSSSRQCILSSYRNIFDNLDTNYTSFLKSIDKLSP